MFNFYLATTNPANDVMVVVACDLIGQVAVAGMGWTRQPVSRQEFERTVDSWFRQPRKIPLRLFIDLDRRKMRPGVMEHMQDRHPLGRHSESTRAELGGVIGGAGHIQTLIATFCNNIVYKG